MTYVLNEIEWAKEMISQNSLGDKPFETLCRVAKYYISEGYKGHDLRMLMCTFLVKCDPCISIPKWEDTIKNAISRAQKYKLVMIDEIVVTKNELEAIRALKSIQTERLAFTLLCLAKYYDAVNPNSDHWVNAPDNDIMRMANINTSIRRQSAMYHTLNELGMIQFSKKVDNTNIRVCFEQDGDAAISVVDMRNIGYQYMRHVDAGRYIVCQNCGITAKADSKGGRPAKYCRSCAAEIKLRQNVESVMRRKTSKLAVS